LQVVFGVPAARLLAVYRHNLLTRFVLPMIPEKNTAPDSSTLALNCPHFTSFRLPDLSALFVTTLSRDEADCGR